MSETTLESVRYHQIENLWGEQCRLEDNHYDIPYCDTDMMSLGVISDACEAIINVEQHSDVPQVSIERQQLLWRAIQQLDSVDVSAGT